jgi:hypothetical protein
MCPIKFGERIHVTFPAVACEVVADGAFKYLNRPTLVRLVDGESLGLGFGKRSNGEGRDFQIRILVKKPDVETEILKEMVTNWYRFNTQKAWDALDDLRKRFLKIISQPAMVEVVDRDLIILHPIQPGTKIQSSLVIYTSFESDAKIKIPENKDFLHGRFGTNGHVIVALLTTEQRIFYFDPMGRKYDIPWDMPDTVAMATEEATLPSDSDAGHETPAASDGDEDTSDLNPAKDEEIPFVPERRPRSGRKLATVGATGRGKGSKRGLDPVAVGADEDEA